MRAPTSRIGCCRLNSSSVPIGTSQDLNLQSTLHAQFVSLHSLAYSYPTPVKMVNISGNLLQQASMCFKVVKVKPGLQVVSIPRQLTLVRDDVV